MEDHRTLDERLVIEPGQVEFVEHSKLTRAKKVVETFPAPIVDSAISTKTIPPIEAAGGTGFLLLERDRAYRIISNGDIRFNLSSGAPVAASATDIYVPKDVPFVIRTREFNHFNYDRTGGMFVQAVEVK